MAAKIICLASAKGGSGKTSLCATFATFLSQLGKSTLLIDADFATNGLTLLFIKEVRIRSEYIRADRAAPRGLYEGLIEGKVPHIVELNEYLDLIPATYDLQVDSSVDITNALPKFIDLASTLREAYDFIFIDAQAGADIMSKIAMDRNVSDEVVIVSEYDPMSAAGVERLKALLRDDLTYERTWILLNKILPEFAKSFADFMDIAKYLSPIPWDAAVVRAYARRQLALDTETGNAHTIAILQTLKGLFGEALQGDISKWAQSRATAIRQPIEEQYADAEKKVAILIERRQAISRVRTRSELWRTIILISAGIAGAAAMLMSMNILASESLQDNLIIRVMSYVGIIAFSMVIAYYIYHYIKSKGLYSGGEVQEEVEELRYDRQLMLLRDQFTRLELLRSLDPEALLGHGEAKKGAASTDAISF